MNKKLAVIFPGMGYHCDKPLLYYARKAAKSLDYDVLDLRYELSRAAADLKNDQEKMRGAFDEALKQSMEQISNIDFSKYENANHSLETGNVVDDVQIV